jgi:hypothetical protein
VVSASMGIPAPTAAGGGVGYTFANKFSVSGAVTINFVRWWKDGASPFPNEIRIRDVTAGATLVQIGPTPATWVADVSNWYTLDLAANGATPPDLVSGHDYAVVEYGENSGYRQAYGDFVAPSPATGITFIRSYWDPGNLAMPTAANSLPTCYGLDVLTSLPVPGPGEGPGTTAGDLWAWLSADPDVQTHETDGLPWLTKQVVDAIATSVGSGLHTAVTAIGTAVTAIGTAVTSTGTAVEGLSTSLATHMGAWSADLAATIQAWNDGLVDWFNKMGGLAGGPVGALSGRSAFPTELWTLADEKDWDTDLSWPVAADLYVFTVTTPPPGAAADSFAGVTWYHRLGSWTILDGDQAGARAFLEFSPQQLQDGGRRMPGLAFRTKNGTLGHVQAWLLA